MSNTTVPEVFAEVPNPHERALYERLYSVLLITNRLSIFQATDQNDLTKFVNAVSVHITSRYMRSELEDGLRGVHYALREGPDMFRKNYCLLDV